MEVSLREESRGHRSLDTIHYYSIDCGGRESHGHRSQWNTQSTPSNSGGYERMSSLTSHCYSHYCRGYVDRSGSSSQDTSNYSSHNQETWVDVEGRSGYRYHNNHYFYHDQGESSRFLTSSGYTVSGDRIFWYMSQTSHYSYKRGYIRGDSAIHGIRSKEINHLPLFNFEESIYGVGISGSRSWTRPSPSHSSGDHGRSSGFHSYSDNRIWHRYHTSQSYAYNHGGINITHLRFPQEAMPRGVHG